MDLQPPKRALQFLRWFCRADYLEEIEGNLIEIFEKQYQNSPQKANRLFLWSVLLHFRPDFIKSFSLIPKMYPGMLKHIVVISLRSFLRNKITFFINLIGLSTGLACFLLISLWIKDEYQVDKFLKLDDQLYQIWNSYQFPNGIETTNYTPGLMAKAMTEEVPEVINATAINNEQFFPKGILSHQNNTQEVEGIFAKSNFFDVFSYEILAGDKKKLLETKSSIVLSEKTALKWFETVDQAIGSTFRWQNRYFDTTFVVSGV